MPDRERIQRGLDFEHRVRDALGQRLVARSGAGWRDKGDVKGRLRISCKAESQKSWGRVREQLREAIDMAFGTGELPALALLEDDGEEIVMMRLSDLAKALEASSSGSGARSRGDTMRELADVPAMLRESA